MVNVSTKTFLGQTPVSLYSLVVENPFQEVGGKCKREMHKGSKIGIKCSIAGLGSNKKEANRIGNKGLKTGS